MRGAIIRLLCSPQVISILQFIYRNKLRQVTFYIKVINYVFGDPKYAILYFRIQHAMFEIISVKPSLEQQLANVFEELQNHYNLSQKMIKLFKYLK